MSSKTYWILNQPNYMGRRLYTTYKSCGKVTWNYTVKKAIILKVLRQL